MPSGIPVATVGINAAENAGILAAQFIAMADERVAMALADYKENLKAKIEKANADLKDIHFEYKTN